MTPSTTGPLSDKAIRDLAALYVQRVLRNAAIAPEGMPELTSREAWQKSPPQKRLEVVKIIKTLAREQLVESGYPFAKVEKIIGR